jgi:hypothetical protein
MVKQYEEGRKQKAEWHKQQKDTQPLYVWEIVSGEHTGTYIVGKLGQHWADFDKPSVPEQADIDEYNKVISASVQSMIAQYYQLMPKVSSPGDTKPPLTSTPKSSPIAFVPAKTRSSIAPLVAPTKPSRKQNGPPITSGLPGPMAAPAAPTCWSSPTIVGPTPKTNPT